MIKNFLTEDQPESEPQSTGGSSSSSGGMLGLLDSSPTPEDKVDQSGIATPFEPESTAETIRRSGMAYSAGIAFSAAVIFMVILGWGADVLLGTSPWGIVGGVIIGSVIGFVQFFRITSQIFKK